MSTKKLPPNKIAGWKGYTLEEMRYQEAYLSAKLHIERELLLRDAGELRHNWFASSGEGIFSRVGTLVQYAGYGFTAYRFIKQAMELMRKKR